MFMVSANDYSIEQVCLPSSI